MDQWYLRVLHAPFGAHLEHGAHCQIVLTALPSYVIPISYCHIATLFSFAYAMLRALCHTYTLLLYQVILSN